MPSLSVSGHASSKLGLLGYYFTGFHLYVVYCQAVN